MNFRDIMSPELAQVYQEESFELPDFATDGLHPRLLRRVKAAEQSLLAAKLRRQCAEDVSEAQRLYYIAVYSVLHAILLYLIQYYPLLLYILLYISCICELNSAE